ncbi:protein enabled homolog [Sceloporus undulatus]|uniref:protein enabled homolog n=1 Tax=Sceloporus undulatus TaxID=8520 RepID=UPI001C4D023D|nr:protein enabled homolog [Sceloporus undulatus]
MAPQHHPPSLPPPPPPPLAAPFFPRSSASHSSLLLSAAPALISATEERGREGRMGGYFEGIAAAAAAAAAAASETEGDALKTRSKEPGKQAAERARETPQPHLLAARDTAGSPRNIWSISKQHGVYNAELKLGVLHKASAFPAEQQLETSLPSRPQPGPKATSVFQTDGGI